ncbi:hypothetical protein CKAN_00431800 [Cinnamomum micranthum f. kanehirae]|uniref:DUF3741 domain-containing protein n=1 Tax=Cinnamomum micranthum f. kanehirae TaxID=337451 RepID=A0A3S3NVD7_9MAGN|nr:hypothetical protein CKAN_00431800 [Cinnamomum micranthum f. kanehirae]
MAEMMVRTLSSRQETTSENQQQVAKKIGCMSGIFQLLHNHHPLLHRKRLTSSSGQKDKTVISPTKPNPTIDPPEKPPSAADLRRLSCDVPRSPTIPAEIRRSRSVSSPENFRRTPALVARLMGLDEIPPPSPLESSAEKRRKLLGALQKCDEDLKALKKIIDAVQVAEDRRRFEKVRRESLKQFVLGSRYKGRTGSKDLDGGDSMMEEKRCSDVTAEQEQPSPVSVLDEISSPPSERSSCNSSEKGGYRLKDDISGSFFHRITVESLPKFTLRKGDDPIEHFSSLKAIKQWPRSRCSKAMVETVNEVWKDGIWEERGELGRMGVVLEGDIFGGTS